MKKTGCIIMILICFLSVQAQKVTRIGPYEVIYTGNILDTTLVESPEKFYQTGKSKEIVTVTDTLYLTEYKSKLNPGQTLKSAWEIQASIASSKINNNRLKQAPWSSAPEAGWSIGFSCLKRLSERMYFGIGLDFSQLNQSIALNTYHESITNLADKDNNTYTGNFQYSDISEKTALFFAGLPLELIFGSISYNRLSVFGSIAFHPAIALGNKSELKGAYQSTGYYPEWKIELHDIPELGFHSMQPVQISENRSKATYLMGGKAALGMYVPLSRHEDYDYNRNLLKISAFFEYNPLFSRQGEIQIPQATYYPGQNNLLSGPDLSAMLFGMNIGFIWGIK